MAKEIRQEDFDNYSDYVNAYEKARLEEVERVAKLTPEERKKEILKEEEASRKAYEKYANEFVLDEAVANGVSVSGEVVKVTKEEAHSREPVTELGKKAVEDRKKKQSDKE